MTITTTMRYDTVLRTSWVEHYCTLCTTLVDAPHDCPVKRVPSTNDQEERAFWDAHIPPGTIIPPPVEVPDRGDEPF